MILPRLEPVHVRIPKPAEWGFNVTICIAALCNSSKNIVCVTDQRVSFADFSADNVVWKAETLSSDWTVLYAGNDVDHADAIIENAALDLTGHEASKGCSLDPQQVANILDSAYADHLLAHIESKLLRKHGFSVESFLKTGRQKCTREVFATMWDKIGRMKLSLQFLLCGFGPDGKGHILGVNGDGVPVSYDKIGFWAIGSGASAAMSSLAFHAEQLELNPFLEPVDAAYIALTAKFMSESATDVGKATYCSIVAKDDRVWLMPNGIEAVRKLWDEEGRPKIPVNAGAAVKRAFYRRAATA